MRTNRSTIRQQFSLWLTTSLVGVGKPVEAVYDHQVGDFKGKSPVLVVTSGSSMRGKPYVQEETSIVLDVHVFVLYSLKAVVATNNPTIGTEVVILVPDTNIFVVGAMATVSDEFNSESSEIVDISAGESITVESLGHNYTEPSVTSWTEEQSEDMIDLIEKSLADLVDVANATDIWLAVEQAVESEIDVVDIGGDIYRHELIPLRFTLSEMGDG